MPIYWFPPDADDHHDGPPLFDGLESLGRIRVAVLAVVMAITVYLGIGFASAAMGHLGRVQSRLTEVRRAFPFRPHLRQILPCGCCFMGITCE